jgi:death on curing protein
MPLEFEPTFLTVDQVIQLHRMQLERYGEIEPGTYDARDWVLNQGMLESSVQAPQSWAFGGFLHESIYAMAAALWHSLACNHAFQNGNKRVALVACSTFLRMNGIRMTLSEDEGLEVTNQMVTHILVRERVSTMLEANCASLE